jgi:uncharacterized membrane protein
VDTESAATERSRDFQRFLTFVDAVVAIAITLLVLPLVDVAGDVRASGSVARLLEDHQAQLWAFLLSFVVIADLWSTQHRVVASVVRSDTVLTRLMVVWLLTIVFLPFPTALVAQAGHEAATKVLYIGTMTLSSLATALISQRISGLRRIRDSDRGPDPRPAWTATLLFAVALALSLAVPAIAYYPLLLLLLPGPAGHLLQRVRPARPGSARVGE